MAGENDFLTSIVRLVTGFDDATWEALANKGLVRRARKDLESGLAITVQKLDDSLRFEVPPFEVTMPAAGPAKASCTCAARGVCQHIVAAGMWLQKTPADSARESDTTDAAGPTQEDIENEMLSISLEQIQQSIGIAALREARRMALSGRRSTTAGNVVAIEFPDHGIEVRYSPAAGFDGAIVRGGAKNLRSTAVAAAILWVHGTHHRLVDEATPISQVLEEALEAPRTRGEVLGAAQALLEEAVQVGLSHVSHSLKSRLQTLAMSAQATNLPRLSRMLRALTDECEAIISRQGRASESILLLAMARTFALVQALGQQDAKNRPDLIGTHRTRYTEVSRLELIGVSAYPWQTPSGYVGLTVLYWDLHNRSWLSWSDARPTTQAVGFDPIKRFSASGPWDGVSSPEESASNKIVLVNARRNPDGRLSSSAATKAMIVGPTQPGEIEFGSRLFSNWIALREHIAKVFPLGLRETHPLDLVVVLQPRRFGSHRFDDQRQIFCWEVFDDQNASFSLVIPYRSWTQHAIKYLEKMEPDDTDIFRIVAKIASSEIGVVAEPLSLHQMNKRDASMVHLAFTENDKSKSTRSSVLSSVLEIFRGADDDWEESAESELSGPRNLEGLFARIEGELEKAAESGTGAFARLDFEAIRPVVERHGMIPLARLLGSVREPDSNAARSILTLRYLCSLYRQSLFFV